MNLFLNKVPALDEATSELIRADLEEFKERAYKLKFLKFEDSPENPFR